LLLLILSGFAVLKTQFNPRLNWHSADGSYYYQIAQHVSEGHGLRSRVSVYHQGFQSFPHRVAQSPGWPLVLGLVGSVFGLDNVTFLLPELLYGFDLILIYLLANALMRSVRGPPRVGAGDGWLFRQNSVLELGHVAVLLLGASPAFFHYTSLPFTEGLAFALLLGSLLALHRGLRTDGLGWFACCGLLAGLALLTRAQHLALLGVAPLTLCVAALRDRSRLRGAAIALACSLAPLLVWLAYLMTWLEPITFGAVLGLGAATETPELLPFPHVRPADTILEYLQDRGSGFIPAFHPRHPHSYTQQFGWAVYVAPLAGAYFLWRARGSLGRLVHGLAESRLLSLAVLIAAIGLLVPVHAHHATFYKEWLFGHRHGLPYVLLVLLGLAYLDGAPSRVMRGAAVALLAATLATGASKIEHEFEKRHYQGTVTKPEAEFLAWLDGHYPTAELITTRPQHVSAHSRSYFHWIRCSESFEQTLALLKHTGATYVAMRGKEKRCNFLDRTRRTRELKKVIWFGKEAKKITVFELRKTPLAADELPESKPQPNEAPMDPYESGRLD
jgi:hypothetical protein